jgi:DNA-binding PadR family transcriptional regulator
VYELFLLGKLLGRPWYGYEFQQALSGFFGPQRRVSWGTIYPLFQRLERDGLIRAKPQRGAKHTRDKQAYTITPSGIKRFLELMSIERVHDPDFREVFRIKLGHFSRVQPEIRKRIVSSYLGRLHAIEGHSSKMSRIVKQIPEMSDEEREMILLALHHERSLAEREAAWMREHLGEFLAE